MNTEDGPPTDSRAEDALLSLAYIFPEYVGRLDLNGQLHCLEHQRIWRAMGRVHMRTPELNVGEFWLALRAELHAQLCHTSDSHAPERYGCQGWRYLQVLSCDHAMPQDVPYWMARLRRVTEARRLIADAQSIAERAWRLDVDGARRVAAGAGRQESEFIRIDV